MAARKSGHNSKLRLVRCVWGLLCSLSSIDQERHNISLFNVINQVNVPSDFFVQQKQLGLLMFTLPHELVLLWRRTIDVSIANEPLQSDFKVKIIDPSGVALQETVSPLHFPNHARIVHFRIGLMAIPITIPGDYVYQVELRQPNKDAFEIVCEIPLVINEFESKKGL